MNATIKSDVLRFVRRISLFLLLDFAVDFMAICLAVAIVLCILILGSESQRDNKLILAYSSGALFIDLFFYWLILCNRGIKTYKIFFSTITVIGVAILSIGLSFATRRCASSSHTYFGSCEAVKYLKFPTNESILPGFNMTAKGGGYLYSYDYNNSDMQASYYIKESNGDKYDKVLVATGKRKDPSCILETFTVNSSQGQIWECPHTTYVDPRQTSAADFELIWNDRSLALQIGAMNVPAKEYWRARLIGLIGTLRINDPDDLDQSLQK